MKYSIQEYNNAINYLKKYVKETNQSNEYYNKCVKELSTGRPIQYIIGNVNFYGNIINVNESVLIPRYETELLVDKTISKIKTYFQCFPIDIVDLGTGSGCIAITLKKYIDSRIDAIDISKDALELAKTNARNNLVNINFINKDMTTYKDKLYDLIISNPPYIKKSEKIMDIVKDNEPNIALYAKENGLYFYKKIIENIPYITKDKYLVALEIGESQSTDIVSIIKTNLKDVNISIEKDYQGKKRFIFITNKK